MCPFILSIYRNGHTLGTHVHHLNTPVIQRFKQETMCLPISPSFGFVDFKILITELKFVYEKKSKVELGIMRVIH